MNLTATSTQQTDSLTQKLWAQLESISNFFFATKQRTNITVAVMFAALISAKFAEHFLIVPACGV